METERSRPIAVFMAFGTKGDVYPIAAVAAGFACDQKQYYVVLTSHSAHENLSSHLAAYNVTYLSVSSPPVLSTHQNSDSTGSPSFSQQKRMVIYKHRKECYSVFERIFGSGPIMEGDFVLINFFALEGWSLAELFHVRCIVAAPYVVPYSAPSSFERQFIKESPLLYEYLKETPTNKVSWKDVTHWMWPLFTEYWGSWRYHDLNLSTCPFTDPVTCLPTWHDRPSSPLLLYGFSKEVVECPDYWPSKVHACGFWFIPSEWQFSCKKCMTMTGDFSAQNPAKKDEVCSTHIPLHSFLEIPPIFIGLSSIGSMGFFKNPSAFLCVLQNVIEITNYRFILLTAGYEPLEEAVEAFAVEGSSHLTSTVFNNDCAFLFSDRLICFSGSIPYNWLLHKCMAAIHHGGSGSTAAALYAGTPQVVCPFILDQFYWAERMHWLGVAPEPLRRNYLLPENNDERIIVEAASMLSSAIKYALSPRVKARAVEIAQTISLEDGVSEAVRKLKEEMCCG